MAVASLLLAWDRKRDVLFQERRHQNQLRRLLFGLAQVGALGLREQETNRRTEENDVFPPSCPSKLEQSMHARGRVELARSDIDADDFLAEAA